VAGHLLASGSLSRRFPFDTIVALIIGYHIIAPGNTAFPVGAVAMVGLFRKAGR